MVALPATRCARGNERNSTMTPDAIMAAFEGAERLPADALRAAGSSRDVMVPVFLDYLDRLGTARIDDLDHMQAWMFIAYLLAEWREPRAFRPLAALMRRDAAFADTLMGDVITEAAARIMADVFDGDPQPLFDVVLDPAADSFARAAMVDTLVLVALHHPGHRAGIEDFVAGFHGRAGPDTEEEMWWAWAEAVAALGLSHLAAQVQSVFDRGLISPQHSRHGDFAWRLQATLDTGRADWFEGDTIHRPILDAAAELASWYRFSAAARTDRARQDTPDWARSLSVPTGSVPVTLPPKVGRNDPCPCGSGRKHKKCCLA
jgi:hypothetical protein